MKPFRLVLIGAAAIVVLLAAAVTIALNSSFQTWMVRRALADQPALGATVGKVSAGFGRVEVHDLRVDNAGVIATVPRVVAELPLLSAAFRDRVLVSRLVATGWTIDLSKPAAGRPRSSEPSASVASSAAAAFAGVFGFLELPVDLAIDAVQLEGDVILPAGRGKGKVNVSGGGLGVGREGRFLLVGDAVLADRNVNALGVRGTVHVAMDTPRTFTRVAARFDASAQGQQFPTGVKLSADLSAVRGAGGEEYALAVVGEGRPLASLQAILPVGAKTLEGRWKLDVRDADLAPFALGQPLPAFTSQGEGSFNAEATFQAVRVSGKLAATGDRLQVLDPKLAGIGAFALSADFDLAQRGSALVVSKLDAAVRATEPVASVQALQPFTLNLRTRQLEAGDPARDLLGIGLQGVPLAWLRPFLGDVTLAGGNLRGDLVATARSGGVMIRSKTPLTASGLSLSRPGQPILEGVELTMNATGDYAPQGWQADFAEVNLTRGRETLLTFSVKAGRLAGDEQPLKATGKLAINLPVFAGQPVAPRGLTLARGEAAAEFIASLGATKAINAKVVVRDLAGDPKIGATFPTISTDLRADVSASNQVTLHFPLLIEREGRKSDLLLTGTLTPGADVSALDAKVTSSHFVVADAQVLSAMLPAPKPTAAPAATAAPGPAPAPTGAPTPSNQPPWAHVKGAVTLALNKVVYADSFEVSDLVGTLRVDGTSLKLEGMRAGLGEGGQAKFQGTVLFDAGNSQPFGLLADLAMSEFDPGPLLRALNPGQPATLEGRFNIVSKVTGHAASLLDLPGSVAGDFAITSREGISRLLPVSYATKVETGGRIASWIAKGSSALDALKGRADQSDLTNYAQAVTEITRLLSSIQYDQLNVVLSRDASLNATLEQFTLISPELRLTGSGHMLRSSGSPFLDDQLAMEFKLRARGHAGEVLKFLGTLDQTADELGYFGSNLPLKIRGTLGRPDTTELNQRLASIALERSGVTEKAADLFNKLLGK